LPFVVEALREPSLVKKLLLKPLQLPPQKEGGLIDEADQRVRGHLGGSGGNALGVGLVGSVGHRYILLTVSASGESFPQIRKPCWRRNS
jgi:hypothetical protein